MNNKVKTIPKQIKGIPYEVFREAKACAALEGLTLGQYVTAALIYRNAQVMATKPKK